MTKCEGCKYQNEGAVCEDCIRDILPNTGAIDRFEPLNPEPAKPEAKKDQPKGFRTKKLDAARKKKMKEIEGMTDIDLEEAKKKQMLQRKKPDVVIQGGFE